MNQFGISQRIKGLFSVWERMQDEQKQRRRGRWSMENSRERIQHAETHTDVVPLSPKELGSFYKNRSDNAQNILTKSILIWNNMTTSRNLIQAFSCRRGVIWNGSNFGKDRLVVIVATCQWLFLVCGRSLGIIWSILDFWDSKINSDKQLLLSTRTPQWDCTYHTNVERLYSANCRPGFGSVPRQGRTDKNEKNISPGVLPQTAPTGRGCLTSPSPGPGAGWRCWRGGARTSGCWGPPWNGTSCHWPSTPT